MYNAENNVSLLGRYGCRVFEMTKAENASGLRKWVSDTDECPPHRRRSRTVERRIREGERVVVPPFLCEFVRFGKTQLSEAFECTRLTALKRGPCSYEVYQWGTETSALSSYLFDFSSISLLACRWVR